MNIDNIAVKLRIRNTWESIDLGFEMARRWFIPLWKIYMITALPIFLILSIIFMNSTKIDWLVICVFWWLKPLYEPPLTYWLSQTLFAQEISIKEIFKQWQSIIKPQLIAHLFWQRLNLNRSFFSPIYILEKPTGQAKRLRLQLFNKQPQTHLLTSTAFIFEWVVFFAFSLILYLMMPNEFQYIQFISDNHFNYQLASFIDNSLYFLALSVIAPFYVSAGFSLYINRRIALEAWDLEIEFKKIVQDDK